MRGSAPRNSCSTAATPAPAAATTSCIGGIDAGRQPVPAPARPAREPHRLLAEPSRRSPICSPACSSGRRARRRASTRRATTRSTSSRSRWRRSPTRQQRRRAALARRPPVPQPADRRHRQHAPRRDLHRQALLARRADRPARPGRVPLLRDAAARAHEPRAAAAAARARRLVLGRALHEAARCAGARRCTTASCCRTSSGRTSLDVLDDLQAARALPFEPEWFAPHFEFRFPRLRRGRARRRRARAAPGARALARAGRGRRGRRHRALRRFVGRAAAGAGAAAWTGDRHVVTCNGRALAAAADRHARRIRRRRALPRVAARLGLHPTIPPHAPLDFDLFDTWSGPLARRLPLSCRASGRAQSSRPSRSTPTRPRAAGSRASSASGTRRERSRSRLPRPTPSTPSRSTCAAKRGPRGARLRLRQGRGGHIRDDSRHAPGLPAGVPRSEALSSKLGRWRRSIFMRMHDSRTGGAARHECGSAPHPSRR